MFRISKAEEQAMRLTMRLASAGIQQTLGELAEAERLPEPTVAKLLGQLKRGGVVDAVRGRRGGYVLADRPAQISASRILQCVSTRPIFAFPCKDDGKPKDCTWSEDCGLRPFWYLLEARIKQVLELTSVADMLQKESIVSARLNSGWPPNGE
jgi:Rrf2 family protein